MMGDEEVSLATKLVELSFSRKDHILENAYSISPRLLSSHPILKPSLIAYNRYMQHPS